MVLSAGPAGAAQDNTNFTALTSDLLASFHLPSALPFSCEGGQGGGLTSWTGTGHGVLHDNSNNNGDWMAETQEGQVTLTMTPGDTYTGHLTMSIEADGNRQNITVHVTMGFIGIDTSTNPHQAAHIHAGFVKTSTPSGKISSQHFFLSCT